MLADAEADDIASKLDGGLTKLAAAERFCAVTRVSKPADDMIRFVLSPQREVVPDVRRKLPGRGLWITATRSAVDQAVRRNVFARGFKTEVRGDANLAVMTGELLLRAALDALAIAGKAGLVMPGFSRVEEAIGGGHLAGLVHASDAAADGKRKIGALLRRRNDGEAAEIPVIEAFSSAQLDLALGRLNVIHAALLAGSASDTFIARASRLASYLADGARDTTLNDDA